MKSLCIILPAYNEEKAIGDVLENLIRFKLINKNFDISIVVVNDGSVDNTDKISHKFDVKLLNHVINRGLGGALATGLEFAKRNNFDMALTMDSDGQHDINDIMPAITPLFEDKADVVIGSRLLGQKGMPNDRIVINKISNLITFLLFGIWTTDSQSGFRAFNKTALSKMNLITQGMEVSSEFFGEIKKHNLRLREVPIKIIYSDYSRTKGQSNLNSIFVAWKLLLRKFR